MKGRGPADLIQLSIDLSERMLIAAGVVATREAANARCRAAIESGAALEKFRAIITRQGGDPRVVDDYDRLPNAPSRQVIAAGSAGFVTALDAGLIGRAVVMLGGGRDKMEDAVDPGVGIMIKAIVGDEVRRGDAILELNYRDAARLDAALPLATRAIRVEQQPPPASPLIIEEVL